MYVNISSQWYRPLVQLIVSNRKSTWNIIDEWTSVTCYLMYEDVLLMTPDKYLSHRFYFSSPNRNDHLKFFNHLGSIFIRNKPFFKLLWNHRTILSQCLPESYFKFGSLFSKFHPMIPPTIQYGCSYYE